MCKIYLYIELFPILLYWADFLKMLCVYKILKIKKWRWGVTKMQTLYRSVRLLLLCVVIVQPTEWLYKYNQKLIWTQGIFELDTNIE